MADEDDGLLDDGGSAPAPAKKKGMGGLLPGLLKWIIIGLAAIILVVVVSVVTASLVAKKKAGSAGAVSGMEERSATREIFDWYKSIDTIQTTTCDDNPATVRVTVFLGYKKDDKATSTEITNRSVELKDFLRKYFRSKTAAELKNADNEEKLKMEIRNGINDKILSDSRIRDVMFDNFDVIDPN